MGDYDTSFGGEDETLGWFDWLFKPKARRPATAYDRRVRLVREINTLIVKRRAVYAKIRTNTQQINRLTIQARSAYRRSGSLTPIDESEYAMDDDTLGLMSWLLPQIFKRKPKSITAQIAALREKRRVLFTEYRSLGAQIAQKRALYARLPTRTTARARAVAKAVATAQAQQAVSAAQHTRAVAEATRARAVKVAQQRAEMIAAGQKPFDAPRAPPIAAAMEGLTAPERKELLRRMRWGWAQRPGAPDMPGEASAMIESLSKYKYNLATRIRNRLIAERRMGWAKRPGAPDMPGEAEAMFKKYGVTLGPGMPNIDEELIL